MQAMIDELAKQAEESLGQVSSKETLASFWQEYLSKNGKIPALMKNLRTVAPEERPAMGKIINELKAKVQAEYDAAAEKVKAAELAARNAAETVDITLPAKTRPMGGLHPLTLITNQIIDVFSGMGFSVGTFPEIEDDDHNFTRLNVPRMITRLLTCRTPSAIGGSCCAELPAARIRTMGVQAAHQDLMPGRVTSTTQTRTHLAAPCSTRWKAGRGQRSITWAILQERLNTFVRLFGADTITRHRVLHTSRSPRPRPGGGRRAPRVPRQGCPLCRSHRRWIEVLGGGVVNRKGAGELQHRADGSPSLSSASGVSPC